MSGPIKAKAKPQKPQGITLKITKNAADPSKVAPNGAFPTGVLQPLAMEVAQEIRKAERQQNEEAKRNKFIVQVEDPWEKREKKAGKILNEEDYVEAVSAIIERDFFPDLPHLRYKHAIMEAHNKGDDKLADDLQRKLDA